MNITLSPPLSARACIQDASLPGVWQHRGNVLPFGPFGDGARNDPDGLAKRKHGAEQCWPPEKAIESERQQPSPKMEWREANNNRWDRTLGIT